MNVRAIIVSVLLCTLLLATPARADGEDPGLALGAVSILGGELLTLSGGLVTGIGGAVMLRREHPSRRWFVADCVLGALNLGAGLAMVSLGFAVHDTSYVFVLMATPNLGIGAANLALGSYGLWRREAPKISLVPLLGRDSANRPFGGIGVQLATF
jgi:hypothetical protein